MAAATHTVSGVGSSARVNPKKAVMSRILAVIMAWVIGTGLGRPVEPEV